jgi:gliding motility-associated lipoprotein GldD
LRFAEGIVISATKAAPMRFTIFFFLFAMMVQACEEPALVPKPRAYPKVVYPERGYQPFTENYCDFTFEYPVYATIQQDTAFFDEKPAHPCWFNVYFPDFECRIHCSYVPITAEAPLDKLKTDAFKMTDWHNKKATYIDERPFLNPNGVKGMLFEVEGPVASQMQFYMTDSLEQKHFMRGALYFYAKAQPDSLAPVYNFVKEDVLHMIETFKWTQ